MGNLYTQVKTKTDYRVTLLFKLKCLWRNRPIDHEAITKLQQELIKLDSKKKQPKPLTGALHKGYLKRLATGGELR